MNIAVFPAVARGRAGVRIVLTCRQTLEDVAALVDHLAACLPARARAAI